MPVRTADKKIRFAVVREDPRLEIELVRRCGARKPLIVGSGGCTVLSLASRFAGLEVTIADPNENQIALIHEKCRVLRSSSFENVKELFNVGTDDAGGLCQNGEFESLFRTLRFFVNEFIMSEDDLSVLLTSDDDLPALLSRLTAHRYWPVAFELFFSDEMLNTMFGPAATQHAQKGSYPEYFRKAIERGLKSPRRATNYFLHHIFLGRYLDEPRSWPDYLVTAVETGSKPSEAALNFVSKPIEQMGDLSKFDFVGLSNIFDWMNPLEIKSLAERLNHELPAGASIVIRQLNNDQNLKTHFDNFEFDEKLEREFLEQDRSLFYNRFVVGREAAMNLDTFVTAILDDVPWRTNPYFVSLRDGSLDFEDFVETQKQFYFAVTFFSRPMAALAAKIPSSHLRIEIVRNIWEEHGEGKPGRSHGETFETFLSRLARIEKNNLEAAALWPEVRQFNTTLAGACVLDEYLIGAATLGVIERMFCEISAWIGEAVVARGWLTREQMIHYDLHETLDIRHAQDFFNVLLPAWDRGESDRYYIEQGLRLGATAFNTLYEGLYRQRARRLVRQAPGPHSRT